jgi:NAD(P)-dependent dehydrogenase (short-subunit alcohol dehydrogenase family)
MSNKTAIVTGASSGMGLGITKTLLAQGKIKLDGQEHRQRRQLLMP